MNGRVKQYVSEPVDPSVGLFPTALPRQAEEDPCSHPQWGCTALLPKDRQVSLVANESLERNRTRQALGLTSVYGERLFLSELWVSQEAIQ